LADDDARLQGHHGHHWKQSEYSANDLKEFQLKIDAFFAAYVERSGAAK